MDFDNSWNCDTCANVIPNCLYCEDDGTCRNCAPNHTPSLDRTECFEIYENCAVLPDKYTIGTKTITQTFNPDYILEFDDYICPTCDVGYYWVDIFDGVGGCVGECYDFN